MGNTDSRPLMCGWIEATQDGRLCYYHTGSGATSFKRPKEEGEISRMWEAIIATRENRQKENLSRISQLQAQIKASEKLVTRTEVKATKYKQANDLNLKQLNHLLAEKTAV
ncbi:hypothetical protein LTR56_008300 [Elasticomyces elasticus]|nr:hypothetical protein LTR56_008300 [Elasticomyces elasticus]KAK3661437.1 hypothetical protein LTR22_007446 [Elasticomyces elasticus]KAK4926206.1 hypothetical protein LTR49_006911 [Elasticomyces elasticus]KAK5750254.1 hypothetical protein LTS12_019671 [Elasticomyces elasticus]